VRTPAVGADGDRPGATETGRPGKKPPGCGRTVLYVSLAPSFRIRPGTVRDLGTIWTLIRGLAAYERRPHAVKATVEHLRRDGFGRRRYFKTLLCLRGREPVGLALYFFAYSTFLGRPVLYLEDLFVVPRHRGNGAGRALLAALARTAIAAGCSRMTWSVLRWNQPAMAFYRRLGATDYDAWTLMSVGGEALVRLAQNGRPDPARRGRPPQRARSGRAGGVSAAPRRSRRASPSRAGAGPRGRPKDRRAPR